jgi:uncharacterized protein with FMN-binding domain
MSKRIVLGAIGSVVGLGALASVNALRAANADPSVPLPPNTNLDQPVEVTASANVWAYARSPQLSLTTSVSPVTVTPGSKVSYRYDIANLSQDTSFGSVVVSDGACSPVVYTAGDINNDKQINVGETWTYTCSTVLQRDTQNSARVTAKAIVNPTIAPTTSPTPTSTPSALPSPSSTPSKVITDGTYLGSLATVNVGGQGITYQVQVSAVIAGGHITSITMPTHTETDATSKNIVKFNVATGAGMNGAGNDTMIDRAIAANSATIAAVAGATYTTAGFRASLQTALTAAGY